METRHLVSYGGSLDSFRRNHQHGISWRGTDILAKAATGAAIGYNLRQSLALNHRAGNRTVLHANRAKRRERDAEAALDYGDALRFRLIVAADVSRL